MRNHTGILKTTLFGTSRINHKQNTPMPSTVSRTICHIRPRLLVPMKGKMMQALTISAAKITGIIQDLLMALDVANDQELSHRRSVTLAA